MALLNAYILYNNNTDRPLTRHAFTQQNNPLPIDVLPGPAGDVGHNLLRLTETKLRKCIVCSTPQKSSRSRYWCPGCQCGIHPTCYCSLEHYVRPTRSGRKRMRRAEESGSQSD
ncbi:hypothetical protein J6590_064385 [Homalodisca vitripennis]|nr:hypothetical protein J6590_064385 [Homalodisca vitripennis]